MWKRFVTLLIVLIMAGTLTGCALVGAGGASGEPVTVMSYNIRIGAGPANPALRGDALLENLGALANYMEETGADILLLQEVDNGTRRGAEADQAALLGEKLGFHHFFVPALELQGGEYGIAILSRWPILETDSRMLFKPDYSDNPDAPAWWSEQRVLAIATVDSPAGPIRVMNTHLGLTQDQRFRQLTEIARLVQETPRGTPVIFGGDINCRPDAEELDIIRGILNDTYTTARRAPTGRDPLTFHALDPNRTIDYIFVSDQFDTRSVRVDAVTLSDHRPVVAELRLEQDGER